MYGGTSPSGAEKPLLVPLELAGKPLTRIENRKLGWVLGASTDVRAWIMSSPDPGYRVPVWHLNATPSKQTKGHVQVGSTRVGGRLRLVRRRSVVTRDGKIN